jgi:monoamine oxidase
MALNYIWTEYDDDDQILVGFGSDPQKLDVYDDDMVQKAVREYLPEAEVLESFSYDWNIDPYSKGTWCMYPPRSTSIDCISNICIFNAFILPT